MRTKIVGIGHYVPERIITNKYLETLMDTSDDWIRERSGIVERRWAVHGVDTPATMGVKAALQALERANLKPSDVDFIIFATLSPDFFFPGSGVLVQQQLGIGTVGALDIRNQCSGFVYGLSIADAYIRSGMYKTILLIGSEVQSVGLDLSTRGRNMSVLFGDGAGAAVLQGTDDENSGILSSHLHSQGEFAEKLYLREPSTRNAIRFYDGFLEDYDGIYPQMDGTFVFKNAVTRFEEVIIEALKANNLTTNDIDIFVPHQANLRITQMVQRKLGLRDDQVYSNIHKYGNTTAATIPICLSELWEQGRLKDGTMVALAAFGSGFTWASTLMKW